MKTAWTDQDIRELAAAAVLNALDDADDDGTMTQTFESEMEFQLAAPEHANRRKPTRHQMNLARVIWKGALA